MAVERVSLDGTIGIMTESDRHMMRAYYDEFGNTEWERYVKDISGRVSFEVHK